MSEGAAGRAAQGTAREGRLAEAYAGLHAAVLVTRIPYGPAGHALLPEPVLARCTGSDGIVRLAEIPVGGDRWLAIHRGKATAPAPHSAWRSGLLRLRLGASRWLLDRCLCYLSQRSSGGNPLVGQQLVRADLADAAADQLTVELSLDTVAPDALDPELGSELHQRLVWTDRALLRLLGASGYLSEGPGQLVLLSELLADLYGGRVTAE